MDQVAGLIESFLKVNVSFSNSIVCEEWPIYFFLKKSLKKGKDFQKTDKSSLDSM